VKIQVEDDEDCTPCLSSDTCSSSPNISTHPPPHYPFLLPNSCQTTPSHILLVARICPPPPFQDPTSFFPEPHILPWRQRHQVPPKCWYPTATLHGITSKKTSSWNYEFFLPTTSCL